MNATSRGERCDFGYYGSLGDAAGCIAADKGTVGRAMMALGREIELVQRHKAESDMAVAAASILARDEFERHHRETISVLSIQLGLLLMMVVFSANISAARQLI